MPRGLFPKFFIIIGALLVVASVSYAGLVVWRDRVSEVVVTEELPIGEDQQTIGRISPIKPDIPEEGASSEKMNRQPSNHPSLGQILPEVDTADWEAYRDEEYGFEVKYPQELTMYRGSDRIVLDFPSVYSQGNNLHRASIYIFATKESLDECATDRFGKPFSERVIFNGIPYYKHHSFDSGHGSRFEFLGYTTYREGVCYDLILEMFYTVIGGTSEYKGPEFDKEKIVSSFDLIVSTFQILQ